MLYEVITQSVVAINYPAVEVVKVTGSKAPTIKRDEGTQIGRQHRDNLEDHPLRLISRIPECVYHSYNFV